MRAHLRRLGNDCCIDIFNEETLFLQQLPHMFQQFYGRNSFILRLRIGKMLSDIPKRRSPQQGIHNGMKQHIRIRMPKQPPVVGNFHSPYD